MKKKSLFDIPINLFHWIHHKLLRLSPETKRSIWLLLLVINAVAFGFDNLLSAIKVGEFSNAYETLGEIPIAIELIRKTRYGLIILSFVIVLAMYVKRKMVIISLRSVPYELENANTDGYETIYRVMHKEIDLYDQIKDKTASEGVIGSVKEIEKTVTSTLDNKRHMKVGVYGSASSPFLFKMGTLLKDIQDVKIFHKFLQLDRYSEWSQTSQNFNIERPEEIHPVNDSNEMIVYISTISKPDKDYLIDLGYRRKHILIFTGEHVGFDAITSYPDAEKAVHTINTRINENIKQYNITKIDLVILASPDVTIYLGMKLRIKEGVNGCVYLSEPAINHPWSIDTRAKSDNCFRPNPECIKSKQELLLETNRAFYEYITSQKYNAYLATRKETDNKERFPLAKKTTDVDRLTFLNLASTTFISGDEIAKAYETEGAYAEWFYKRLESGKLEATVIVNNPHSYAAKDAALSKMNPQGLKMEKAKIIQHNINALLNFKAKNPRAKIKLYLTDICLPYGIMLAENSADRSLNYMKVDLYSPLGEQEDQYGFDEERPSFYLLYNDQATQSVYQRFLEAIDRVKKDKNRTIQYIGKKLDWILKKPIIHRGRISKDIPEHSIRGYFACIAKGYPMEIDILVLKDQTMLVGRDEVVVHKKTNERRKLSELTLEELRFMKTDDYYSINETELKYRFEELMTIDELLCLVNGKVGLVIELKVDSQADSGTYESVAERIIDSLRYYEGNYCIHAANPYILKAIRELDQTIVLGQISWSFNGVNIPEEYRKCHEEMTFMDVVTPDFISYKISEICCNDKLIKLCNEKELPLLTWTILNKEDEEVFHQINLQSKNVIIEGAQSYL